VWWAKFELGYITWNALTVSFLTKEKFMSGRKREPLEKILKLFQLAPGIQREKTSEPCHSSTLEDRILFYKRVEFELALYVYVRTKWQGMEEKTTKLCFHSFFRNMPPQRDGEWGCQEHVKTSFYNTTTHHITSRSLTTMHFFFFFAHLRRVWHSL